MRIGEIARTKGTLALALVIALGTLAAACGGGVGGTSAAGGGATTQTGGATAGQASPLLIGNSVPQGSDPTLQLQTKGLEAEAARNGDKVITVDANLDPSKQISDVDSLIQKGVDVLVIWPLDGKSIQPALDRAKQAGIPVITRQTTVGGPYFTNIELGMVGSGAGAADYLAKKLGKGAKVAAILGPDVVQNFREANEGFRSRAKELGLDVVDTQTNDKLAPEESATFVQGWKQRFGPEIKGIWDSLDADALGSASQFDDGFKPLLVTQGGSEEGIDGVRKGLISSVWYVQPVLTGRAEGWAAHLAGQGKTLPHQLNFDLTQYTDANVGEFKPVDVQLDQPITFGVTQHDGKTYLTAVS